MVVRNHVQRCGFIRPPPARNLCRLPASRFRRFGRKMNLALRNIPVCCGKFRNGRIGSGLQMAAPQAVCSTTGSTLKLKHWRSLQRLEDSPVRCDRLPFFDLLHFFNYTNKRISKGNNRSKYNENQPQMERKPQRRLFFMNPILNLPDRTGMPVKPTHKPVNFICAAPPGQIG